MILHVSARHALGRFHLDVDLALGGPLTALTGPSGAGKTSTLNVIAGLLRPDAGLVRLDDEVLVDTARGVWRPPHQRRLGYVFQDARLFPHLTVRQNLMFGRWFSRTRRDTSLSEEVISLLDLDSLLARRPARLSGGERQRVAIGRALLSRPRLLLLDEPLASVNLAKRGDVLPYLDRLRGEWRLPIVHVTHNLEDIAGRADDVVTMADGHARYVTSGVST